MCNLGKVSYLGGHRYTTAVPISANDGSQGTRLFLNALFEADCVTTAGQPQIVLTWAGPRSVTSGAEQAFTVRVSNTGRAAALDAVLTVTVPDGISIVTTDAGATVTGQVVSWDLGSIGAARSTTPASSAMRALTLGFPAGEGTHTLDAHVIFHVGASTRERSAPHMVLVGDDRDGDGIPDVDDPFPDDANRCGDSDRDTCDDCSVAGASDPSNDGPDTDGDGTCDAGEDGGVDAGDTTPRPSTSGCGCRASGSTGAPWAALTALAFVMFRRRRASSRRRAA
jgi:uncharacterized repeat protein (TIGR01451 family)/MYXO-CTERM domain-containing protein